MNEARKQLEQIGRGCVATLYGVSVQRVGDRYIIGRGVENEVPVLMGLENAAYTLSLLK